MHVTVLLLSIQALTQSAPRAGIAAAADSAREVARAHAAQVSFERSRRSLLPPGQSSGGRCDVRLGRFCWWYDGIAPRLPAEREALVQRRLELIATLDDAAAKHPGDDWLAGARVHYRIDGHNVPGADSVAAHCAATAWWCSALAGYAAHTRGEAIRADSAFAASALRMPEETRCAWRNIAALLGDDDRDAYEHLDCNARAAIERRYWKLSRPRWSAGANEWKNEFNARRVIVWLGARSATPHLLTWGSDAEELVLRYGWPTAWSRVETSSIGLSDPSVIGHDPSPSFAFAPSVSVADSTSDLEPGSWEPDETHAPSRYAPLLVRRMGRVAAQFARFRRGDSTLIAVAYAAADDSLRSPSVIVGAMNAADSISLRPADTTRTARGSITMAGTPQLVGVDVADTATGLLLRSRLGFRIARDSGRLALSDLLMYRGAGDDASLESVLPRAIPGDTVMRNLPVGIFWETYGLPADGESLDVAVSIERVDRGWLRSTRQRLGLTPEDTPIRMVWTEARPSAGRGVSLDLTNLDAGRYRIVVSLRAGDGATASTMREFELLGS